ncbi:MAG TPA: pepsin/retropepsin-like aspartic protease family protein [Pyrinomonadaceae bacterium]
MWAASAESGAAHTSFRASRQRGARTPSVATLPSGARLRESSARGLLAEVWVNGVGPFVFAVDTGAGANILSERVAGAARVRVETGGSGIRVGGLSGTSVAGGRRAFIDRLALGSRENFLPSKGLSIVVHGLPQDIDGVLDPTEAFSPLGYIIDLPRGLIEAFDPRTQPVRRSDATDAGAVVEWLREAGGRRPFVLLGGVRRALVGTGSAFGLAVTEESARALGIVAGSEGRLREDTRDLAGGSIASRRIRSANVRLGALALRGVPTDLLLRAEAGAPVLLGRDALRPFRLTFDPLNRLIRIEP